MSGFQKFFAVVLLITSVSFGWLYFDANAILQDQITTCEKHEETIERLRERCSERYYEGFEKGYDSGYYDASKGFPDMYEPSTTSSYYDSYDDSYDDSSDYSITVYITDTGSKYHQSWCSYLKESSTAVSLSDAQYWGYDACSRCC